MVRRALMQNEIARIEIPEYLRTVTLSQKRNPIYYDLGSKVRAKKYLDNKRFQYRPHQVNSRMKLLLTDLKTGEAVVANPVSQGTPSVYTINGQGIYDQTLQKEQRNLVMQSIKAFFGSYVDTLPEIHVPVRIYAELHDTILTPRKCLWDLDNRFYMYQKAFQDCLTGNKTKEGIPRNKVVIKDDNILFITQPPCPIYIPVSTQEERKLVFILCEEKDERIVKNEEYLKLRQKCIQEKNK